MGAPTLEETTTLKTEWGDKSVEFKKLQQVSSKTVDTTELEDAELTKEIVSLEIKNLNKSEKGEDKIRLALLKELLRSMKEWDKNSRV